MIRKKRSYRSVDVNQVDRERLASAVEGKRVVFSIDVSKEKQYGAVMTEDRKVQVLIRWDLVGQTRDAVEVLKGLPASEVAVAMEPTGTYGDPLRQQFQEAGIPVYRVSSKRCHDAAEVYDGVPSYHDAKAAEVIGRLFFEGVCEPWREPSQEERELGTTISVLEMHEDSYGRSRNRIEALLARHWPELTRHLDLSGVTILELLKETGGPRAVREEPGKAAALMRRVARNALAEWKIAAVVKSAMETIGAPMMAAEEDTLRAIAEEARRSQTLKRDTQVRLERMVQQDEEVSRLGEVVGKTTAAVLVAQLGMVSQYASAKSVEKALGLNLKIKSSGKFKGHLKITKRGPGLSRMYLYMAALRLIQHDRVIAAWYSRLVSRNGGFKKKAVVAVMRKLSRALIYVARGDRFDSSKLFNVKLLDLA